MIYNKGISNLLLSGLLFGFPHKVYNFRIEKQISIPS